MMENKKFNFFRKIIKTQISHFIYVGSQYEVRS